MATVTSNESELNDLLEDALSDLLTSDVEPTTTTTSTIPEQTATTSTSDRTTSTLVENEVLTKTKTKPGKKDSPGQVSGNKTKTTKSSKPIESKSNTLGVDENEMNAYFERLTLQLQNEMGQFNEDEARAKINESVPQIFDLMQNLLSKELLYPALKDLSPKFDEWLTKNVNTLSKDDKRRYKKQRNIINEIIEVFDNESMDSQERFEKNLDLMEKMQSLGSPPQELTVPEGLGKCSII